MRAAWEDALADPFPATGSGALLQVYRVSPMTSHGIADDGSSWDHYESYAMRRGGTQQPAIHMTQQMTAKVSPSCDGKTSFFAFEDATDDRRDITELGPEKHGPALRNRLEVEAAVCKRDSCDRISSNELRQCFCIDSCSS